jgi:ornithine carbamoyltransferase
MPSDYCTFESARLGRAPAIDLCSRDVISIADFTAPELRTILQRAHALKAERRAGIAHRLLEGRTLAMIFEKPSLRTRCTFETGMTQFGGHAIDLAQSHMQMGTRESLPDIARNLDRWVDVIMARVFSHQTVIDLAAHARVPVINGLSDHSHPCQILADLQTIEEQRGRLTTLKVAYVGDGNNVTTSLIYAAGILGMDLHVGAPEGYQPSRHTVARARELALRSDGEIVVHADPNGAVDGADVIYTDAWVSMGQEAESAERMQIFPPYQVNRALLARARPDAIVMHCLPAHRGLEITDEVMDGPQSVVFDQAENRLHAQKAVLALILGA